MSFVMSSVAMSSIATCTVPSPRIVFIAHRWPVAADGQAQLSVPVPWPGGPGKLSLASDDPSRALFGARVALQALIIDEAVRWATLDTMLAPGTVEIAAPATLLRLCVTPGGRDLKLTAVGNWYPSNP
jgi:hypothetical protein